MRVYYVFFPARRRASKPQGGSDPIKHRAPKYRLPSETHARVYTKAVISSSSSLHRVLICAFDFPAGQPRLRSRAAAHRTTLHKHLEEMKPVGRRLLVWTATVYIYAWRCFLEKACVGFPRGELFSVASTG
ncbi:hypothetical protein MRX96_039446 [Rhipicephalus microplus]